MASNPITCRADFETPAPQGGAASSSLVAWFVGVAARAAGAIANQIRTRRAERELMAMSDQMLKDIGLTRAQIGSTVRYGRD